MGERKALQRLFLMLLPLVCLCMYHNHGDHKLSRLVWVTVVNFNVYLGKYLIFTLGNIYTVTIAWEERFSDDQPMDCLIKQTRKTESSEEKSVQYKVWRSSGNDRASMSPVLSHLRCLRAYPLPPLDCRLTL